MAEEVMRSRCRRLSVAGGAAAHWSAERSRRSCQLVSFHIVPTSELVGGHGVYGRGPGMQHSGLDPAWAVWGTGERGREAQRRRAQQPLTLGRAHRGCAVALELREAAPSGRVLGLLAVHSPVHHSLRGGSSRRPPWNSPPPISTTITPPPSHPTTAHGLG